MQAQAETVAFMKKHDLVGTVKRPLQELPAKDHSRLAPETKRVLRDLYWADFKLCPQWDAS